MSHWLGHLALMSVAACSLLTQVGGLFRARRKPQVRFSLDAKSSGPGCCIRAYLHIKRIFYDAKKRRTLAKFPGTRLLVTVSSCDIGSQGM